MAMRPYTVRKWFKYSEDVVVYAESEQEAKDVACYTRGSYNNDDYLDSCEVIEEGDDA